MRGVCTLQIVRLAGEIRSFPHLYVLRSIMRRMENLGVQRYQSYKFKRRPNHGQRSQMRRIAGCCRLVFKQALAIQIQRREQGKAELDFRELNQRLEVWRRYPESIWLADVPIGILQQAFRNLERAFARSLSQPPSAVPCFQEEGSIR